MTEKQRKLLFVLAKQRGMDNELLHSYVEAKTGKQSITEVTTKEANTLIDSLQEKLDKDYQWNDEHITLMITHKMLAKQQSYINLLDMPDERLKDGDDPYLEFFSEVVEPLYSALEEKRLTRIFDVLILSILVDTFFTRISMSKLLHP